MKKSRVTALLTACAMVGGMVFGIVPGVYAEEVAPIKIEGESIVGSVTGTSIVPNEDQAALSGGRAVQYYVAGGAGKNNTLSYTVSAEKAGLYTMELVSSRPGPRYKGDSGGDRAAEKSNDALRFLSPYWIQVNDETPFTFAEGSAYDKYGYEKGMKAVTNSPTATGLANGAIQYGVYEIPVYLHEGDNTVSFIVKDKRYQDTAIAYYLDYMEFTYQSRGSANLPVIVEGEDCADANVPEESKGSLADGSLNGGEALKLVTGADAWHAGYTATVARDGMYTLEFASTVQGFVDGEAAAKDGAACKAYSPFTIGINNDTITFGNYTGYEQSRTTLGDGTLMATYKLEVYLQRGVNTIRFQADQARPVSDSRMFALDYLKLSPLTHYAAEDFKVECESYTHSSLSYAAGSKVDQGVRTYTGLSNGKGAYFNTINTIATAPSLDYTFYVENEGDYAVYTAFFRTGQTWTSDLDISVNGGEAITVNDSTSEEISEIKTGGDDDFYRLRVIKPTLVHLKKGYNTMNITTTNAAGNHYMLGADYVRFVKAGTSVTQNASYAAYDGMHTIDGFRYRNRQDGSYVPELYVEKTINKDDPTATMYAEHEFFVAEGSNYALTLAVGANIGGSNTWESECTFSLDGAAPVKLTGDNTYLSGKAGSLADNAVAHWTYKPLITLPAGWHTLRVETAGPAQSQTENKTFFYWHGFTLEEEQTVDSTSLSLADPVITVGESTQAEITYLSASGKELTPEGYSASWGSSNEKVADFDTQGKITAFNPGKTVITACISDADNNEVGQYSAELIVLPAGSTVFAQEASRNTAEKQINVRLSSFGDMPEDEAVSLIVSAYKKENGLPTTLKSVSLYPISDLKNGNNIDIAIPIEDLQADDTVTLYIWKGMDELVPLWTKDVIN